MSELVHRRNVARYTVDLREASNSRRRRVLTLLLAKEAAMAKANGRPTQLS